MKQLSGEKSFDVRNVLDPYLRYNFYTIISCSPIIFIIRIYKEKDVLNCGRGNNENFQFKISFVINSHIKIIY